MKHKIMKISIFILLLTILLPNKIFAISSSGGYQIESYNIDMKVITDFFAAASSHNPAIIISLLSVFSKNISSEAYLPNFSIFLHFSQ